MELNKYMCTWQSHVEIEHYSVSVKNELEVPIKGLGLPHIMCKCQHYLVVLRGLPYSSLFTSAKYLAKTEKSVPVGGALLPNVCSLTPPVWFG